MTAALPRETERALDAELELRVAGRPRVMPSEAIAIALQVSFQVPARRFGPESETVKNILKALSIAGWKIVPNERAD